MPTLQLPYPQHAKMCQTLHNGVHQPSVRLTNYGLVDAPQPYHLPTSKGNMAVIRLST